MSCPPKNEGAGKTGHRLMPMVRVQKKSTRQNHRCSRKYPAFPAQWLERLLRDLPGDRLLNAHIFCCGGRQRLILCAEVGGWRGTMREEIGLGRFGDRRLEKGGCRCTRRWYEGPVRVFDALLGTERGKFSSRAFCATRG